MASLWRGAFLWLLVLLCVPAAQAATLREVALEGQGGSARLTLKLSAPVKQNVFTLDNPHRLVIDLPGTKLSGRLPAAAGPVTAVRSGVQPRDTLRLVLQLSSATSAQVRPQGSTLVVDIAPAGGAAASAAATSATASATAASQPTVAVRPRHAPQDSGRDVVIAIDAGHGGKDPGAVGRDGTREKDVVLAIARALKKRIDAEPGMRAVLTRDNDVYIAHRERIRLARVAGADMFISVHADAIQNRAVAGSSVYVLSERGASSEAARWLAERENAADLVGGVSLGDKDDQLASVLMDLSQSASIGASMEAAERVLSSLDRVGTVRKSQVQQAGFLVLKSPDIPSMLVETAYISNPGEERKLRSPAYQAELAEAIFRGARDYFRRSPPDGTLFARQLKSRGAAPVIAGSTGP